MNKEYYVHLAGILESTEDAIIIKSLDGTIQSWNKGSEKMFGYTSKEMIGKKISSIIPPEFLNDDKNNLSGVSNNKIVDCYETSIIKKNGELSYVSLIVSYLRDNAGNIAGFFQVARDITSSKKIEAERIEALQKLEFQNTEKEKRANELIIANKELAFQNLEKEKRAEELLIANNKYKYLFDNNPLPLFIFDFETLKIIACNIESLMLYGYSREEFLQLTIKDIRPEEDIALILETTKNESAYGEIHKKVWRHLKKNGELMYVEVTGHLLDYNNRRSSLVLINDITANIELEKKQKEYLQFIETTLENLPIGIAVNKIDDGSATLMNQQFSEIYGWPKPDLTDVSTFFEKVYPDAEYREKIGNQLSSDISSKDPEKMNWEGITITTQDGTKKIINAKNIPIYDQNLMISTVVDVTEKFNIIKSLKQSNERYHYATQATSDAIWDWDFENNLVYRAEGFKTIFGFDMDELNLPITSWENYIHPEDKHSVTKSINEKINSSGNYWKYDYRIIRPDGKVAFVQDSAYIIRGENNNVTRIIGAIKDVTQRKEEEKKLSKAADALQKALNDTNKIMDSSLDLICVVDREGYFVKVSAACIAILGYKPEELIGKPLINYVYNIDNEKTQITADVVMSGTSIKHFENRYIRKDGSLVPMEWTARWDENDKLRYGVARDITDRKIAQEKIIESENRMRLATSSAAMGIWYWDNKNDTMVWDKKLYQIYDISESQLGSTYEGWLSRLHPEDKDGVNEVLQTAIADKKTEYSSEFRIIWSDLSVHFIKGTGITEFDDDGNVTGMMGVNWDVTAEKEKEQHLKLLESVITNTKDSVLITEAEPFDEPGPRILYVNEAFTKMTGYSAEEVIGKTPRILQGPKSDKVELKHLSEAIRRWESCDITTINYKKNGEEFWINFTVTPVANEKGCFTHWIAIERDVTERKLAEIYLEELNENLKKQKAELVTSNKELEQFAYVASHDLQEPLRMVTSFLTLLEKRYNTVLDEKGLKYINFAVEGAKSMRQIILDILQFSRIDNNDENIEFIDLKDIIKEISLLQGKLIKEKKAKIIFEELPKINSIRYYLMQLFQNIISNALKYSKEEVPLEIQIKSEEYNNYYQIAITDNGIGIEKEYYEKIFIIFQRLHSKEKYQGTGIGLAIAKKIVDKLNGQIWVESQIGIGSTFYINIPKK